VGHGLEPSTIVRTVDIAPYGMPSPPRNDLSVTTQRVVLSVPGGGAFRISALPHHLVITPIAIARMLHAEGPSPRKSQVTATKSSSPRCRAKVNQPNRLTSHNERSRCSTAFSY
jgi:hypothetical protein